MEPTDNSRTIESYELIAADYAAETSGSRAMSGALARLAEAVPGGHVLEIGSGPGWDADVLEGAGLTVRRTDITQAFIDFQRGRGKDVDRLDVIHDALGGPYDAVVALAVLQHVSADELPGVLAKIAGSLRPGGRFLAAVRTGEGAGWDVGSSGNRYFVTCWSETEFIAELVKVGLTTRWSSHSVKDTEPNPPPSDWLTVLAQRSAENHP